MPRTYVRKKNKPYTPEDLAEAIEKIKNGELTLYTAAQQYSIPKTTLHDRLHTNSRPNAGRPTVLSSEEEERLADAIRVMEKWGFGLSRQEILDIVAEYVKANKIKTPFKNNVPGPDWFINFRIRHRLSIKKAQPVEYVRRKMTDPFFIFEYFQLLEKTLRELNLYEKPQNIWNLDETSMCLDPTRTKVVGAINKPCSRTTCGSGKENITVLAGANADGKKLPPLIVFKGKNIWDQWMAETGDYDFEISYAASPKGWMQADIFYNYINTILIPSLDEERPVLLVYDGHSTHVDIKVIELAIQNDITILKLPPHTSHLLQPLDIAVFKAFKSNWDAKLVDWQRRNIGTKMPKNIFSQTLADTWQETRPDIIKNGFKKAGICPFDPNVIPVEKFDPDAYRRYQKKMQESSAESQLNAKSPESLKSLCIDYFNKQFHISENNLQKQCAQDLKEQETLEELNSTNQTDLQTGNVTLFSQLSKSDSQMTAFIARDPPSKPECLKGGSSDPKDVQIRKSPKVNIISNIVIKKATISHSDAALQPSNLQTGNVTLLSQLSKSDSQMTAFIAKDPASIPKCLKRGSSESKCDQKRKPKENRIPNIVIKKSSVINSDAALQSSFIPAPHPASQRLLTFEEALLKKIQQDKKKNTIVKKKRVSKGAEVITKSMCRELEETEEKNKVTKKSSKKRNTKHSKTKRKSEDNSTKNIGHTTYKAKNHPGPSGIQKGIKRKRKPSNDSTTSTSDIMSQHSDSDILDYVDLEDFTISENDIDIFKKDSSLEELINIYENDKEILRNEGSNNISIKGKGKGKKTFKGKENQNIQDKRQNERDCDNFMTKKSEDDIKHLESNKTIKKEKGEQFTRNKMQTNLKHQVEENTDERNEHYKKRRTKEYNYDDKESNYKDRHEMKEIFSLNDSVLVKYYIRKKWCYYIGFVEKITELDGETYLAIDFLKTVKKPQLVFMITKRKDRDVVPELSIVKKIKIESRNDNKKEYYLCDDDDASYF